MPADEQLLRNHDIIMFKILGYKQLFVFLQITDSIADLQDFYHTANKQYKTPDLSFWRDSQGNEVDLHLTEALAMTAYEIKSGEYPEFFKGLDKWGKLSDTPTERLKVICCGPETISTSHGQVISFLSYY